MYFNGYELLIVKLKLLPKDENWKTFHHRGLLFNFSNLNMESQILSERERQILELIAYENTNDDIAETLYISNQTVKTHRKNLLEKLSARNTAGLIRRAFELGILSLTQPMGAN